MSEPGAACPPEPTSVTGPDEFLERLRQLRLWAGNPSLRRLRQLAGTTVDTSGVVIDALPVSTASRMLRGDRLPRMEFVRAFVTACLRARRRDPATIAVEVERWHEAWLGLRSGPPPGAADESRPAGSVPRQLPADLVGFTGRVNELAQLTKVLTGTGDAGQVAVAAISGPGGVGKSALAIHSAHQLATDFPDGQLYVDLYGATAGLAPLAPLDVLGQFLRALGESGSHIPDQLDEAAARFRTVAAGRRLLLVLDNAADAGQVRPLLPGTDSCRVLVTSRPPLSGLASARHLHLDVLPTPDAVGALAQVIGAERVAAEPVAAAEVVRRCGRLPLALRIAAARLAARPAWPVAALAQRLADEQRRLDELQVAGTGVRASLDGSYRQLRESNDPVDQAAAQAFGLLGIWDGPDLALPVAARLLDRPEAEADSLLERLVDAQLLQTRSVGRYRLHDLLRLYAREFALPVAERTAALERALCFYTATAWHTLALLRPGDRRHLRADSYWRTGGRDFADSGEALAWLDAERPNLLAAATQAATIEGVAAAAVQLAHALFGFFQMRKRWRDLAQLNGLALRVARDAGDLAAEAQAHNDLGGSHHFRGQLDQALACHRQSLAIRERLGDQDGQAASLENLGNMHTVLRQPEQAVACLERSLALRRAAGDRHGEASSLNRLGVLARLQDRPEEAVGSFQQSLAIARELGDLEGQASCLNSLGAAHLAQEHPDQALDCLRQSLDLNRALGNRYGEAAALDTVGTIHHSQGRHAEALECFRRSLTSLREAGSRHDEAEVLRNIGVTLAALGQADDARGHWREALAICEELHLPADELRRLLAGNGDSDPGQASTRRY